MKQIDADIELLKYLDNWCPVCRGILMPEEFKKICNIFNLQKRSIFQLKELERIVNVYFISQLKSIRKSIDYMAEIDAEETKKLLCRYGYIKDKMNSLCFAITLSIKQIETKNVDFKQNLI